jgi:hypothetical protein
MTTHEGEGGSQRGPHARKMTETEQGPRTRKKMKARVAASHVRPLLCETCTGAGERQQIVSRLVPISTNGKETEMACSMAGYWQK